jgi:hypothetical protein
MREFFCFLITLIVFVSCTVDDEDYSFVLPEYQEIYDTYVVTCPEPPIEIMSSLDEESVRRGELLLNCYKIIQVSDNLYYMYYEAFSNGEQDGSQGVYFAYSNDCFHWTKRFPYSSSDDNTIFSSNMMGVDVVKVPDRTYPYRMFSMRKKNEWGLYMWKSKDGLKFEAEKQVLSGLYDTQNAAVVRGDTIKLYVRLWEEGYNRKIGLSYLDLEGNVLATPYVLQDNNVYNSAASYLNSDYDILFPTYFVSSPTLEIEALIARGYYTKRISCNINKWIESDELWVLVSPGIITINGEKYISYNTRNWQHEVEMPEGGISKYKLVKIQIDK